MKDDDARALCTRASEPAGDLPFGDRVEGDYRFPPCLVVCGSRCGARCDCDAAMDSGER